MLHWSYLHLYDVIIPPMLRRRGQKQNEQKHTVSKSPLDETLNLVPHVYTHAEKSHMLKVLLSL